MARCLEVQDSTKQAGGQAAEDHLGLDNVA